MSQYRPLAAVVLAAGEGTRMRSETPKVLHALCGRPMVLHVVDALAELPLERIVVVVGHGAERVTKTLQEQLVTEVPVEFVEQRVQRGTGDAVSVALTAFFDDLDAEDDILVLPGDAPLVRAETLARLATEHRLDDAAATHPHRPCSPTRPGSDGSCATRTIASPASSSTPTPTDDELEIDEINTSIYCFRRNLLAPALRRLSPENAQGEYYLTDAIGVLRAAGHKVVAVPAEDPARRSWSTTGPSSPTPKPSCGSRINRRWMRDGVTMVDPARTYVDATVELEPDVRILPGTILEGRTSIGAGSVIGPDCRLVDAIVGERVDRRQRGRRRGRDRRRLHRRPVRLPAARDPPGRRAPRSAPTSRSRTPRSARARRCRTCRTWATPTSALARTSARARSPRTTTARTSTAPRSATVCTRASHTSLVAPVELGDGAETGAGSVVTHDVAAGHAREGRAGARWRVPCARMTKRAARTTAKGRRADGARSPRRG